MIESFVNIESAEMLAGNVPFLNFVEEDDRVVSCSDFYDGRDCAITVECENMAALESLTKELRESCNIVHISHNAAVR